MSGKTKLTKAQRAIARVERLVHQAASRLELAALIVRDELDDTQVYRALNTAAYDAASAVSGLPAGRAALSDLERLP